jgi:hypothetical protein
MNIIRGEVVKLTVINQIKKSAENFPADFILPLKISEN